MSNEVRMEDNREVVDSSHDSKNTYENEALITDTPRKGSTSTATNCGPLDEICTCVGFLTCQDPDHYEVEEDDDILEIAAPQTQEEITLPDPPQPDPPESHTVLVQRTRNNEDSRSSICAESIMFDAGSSSAPMESFDVIVHSPSRQLQYNEDTDDHCSTVTPTTTSTARRKKPEEYEPLILLIDDEEQQDHDKNTISPTSNCAVRDTSSTSSLQYHRRSPMFLSYVSPQQQEEEHERRADNVNDLRSRYSTTTSRKQRQDMFQSLLQYEISKRKGRTNTTTNRDNSTRAYSIQYNRYSTSKNHHRSMEDTIRGSITTTSTMMRKNKIDPLDRYRYSHQSSTRHHSQQNDTTTSTIATSSVVSSQMDRYHHLMSRDAMKQKEMISVNDTDTVRAVAPDKAILRIHDDDDNESYGNNNEDDIRDDIHYHHHPQQQQPNDHPHFVPTNEVIVMVSQHSSYNNI